MSTSPITTKSQTHVNYTFEPKEKTQIITIILSAFHIKEMMRKIVHWPFSHLTTLTRYVFDVFPEEILK